MTKVTRFEDLKCWQSARRLVKAVFLACRQGELSKDYETKAQAKKEALSVMNNIAEGFGRFSGCDFIRFLNMSQSSCLEIKSMTYTFEDLSYLPPGKIIELCEETKSLTLGLIQYLKGRPT